VTVVDTSAVMDYLLGAEASAEVGSLLARERVVAAPDLLVFEVLAVLRRQTLRGAIRADRVHGAINDLADLQMDIYPTLPLRQRAWDMRQNVTAGDGLFIALAERLGEPLLTKDQALATAARAHANIEVIVVG
jgi:predicted nucleic acid-binding protein